MSVVIIGGHERMENQYKEICKKYRHKTKVFTKMRSDLSRQIGTPDLVILFTATASHKMVRCALDEAKRTNARVVRCHTSSKSALMEILEKEVTELQ